MLKVDNRYIPCTCLIIWALSMPGYSYADSYFCKAEHVSGFVYDLEKNTWQTSTLPAESRQYLISEADIENVFVKALKYDYEIRKVGSAKPIIHCKSVKLTDSNEETGIVLFDFSIVAQGKEVFFVRNARVIRHRDRQLQSPQGVLQFNFAFV